MHIRTQGVVGAWIILSLAALHAEPNTDLRLIDAIRKHDTAAARALLKAGVNVNARQGDGATALHWAAHRDDMELADLLLRAGANVNAADDLGVTALQLACANGSALLAERLLKAGGNPNLVLSTGESPLMSAARAGSIETVKSLVAYGADVNAREASHGQTALMWAASRRQAAVVKSLIEMHADIQARSATRTRGLMQGNRYLAYDDTRDVRDVPEGGFTALLFAARQGDTVSAGYLLDAGADVNDATPDGTSALVLAAHGGQGAFAAYLLDRGANPNLAGSGYTALHAAVLRSDAALAMALLAHHANPEAALTKGTVSRRYSQDYAFNAALAGATPFWLAAQYGDVPMMRLLAAGGANTRAALPDGTTALMAAVAAGAGSGGGAGDRRERYLSPLDLLNKSDAEDDRITLETAQAAIELGGDVNAAARTGDTALHLAASQGLTEVVQLLLDKGGKADAANNAGDTALHLAAARGRNAVIRALAAKGAPLDAANKKGQTPLALSMAPRPRAVANLAPDTEATRRETADLLRQLGAKQ